MYILGQNAFIQYHKIHNALNVYYNNENKIEQV